MSDRDAKLPENKPGRYYVDSRCIDCDVCRDITPANFTRAVVKRYSFVYQQPQNGNEESLCREALAACPVDAIGNDGQ